MKEKDVLSWICGVQVPTPPSSPLPLTLENDYPYCRKRRKMSHTGASTPQKRPRPADESDTVLSLLTDRTRFDPPSSSSHSRQRSPARDLLNALRLPKPPIHSTRPKDIPLPDSALSLRRTLCQGFGSKVIPIGLKVGFHTPRRLPLYSNRIDCCTAE